jgi:MarR family transcriptional regulator, organic hydroperoxide resistance regulator
MADYNKSDSVGFLLFNTAKAMYFFFNKKMKDAGFELTAEHWGVMINLSENKTANQTDLCKCLGKDKTKITRVIDQMESEGLVKRSFDSKDRRNKLVSLTAKGNKIREKLVPVVKENILDEATKNFTSKELADLKKLLNKLHDNIIQEK